MDIPGYSWRPYLPDTIYGWLAHALIFMDLILRIFLAERNAADNLRRLSSWKARPGESPNTQVIVSIVGYREDPLLFKNCLERYLKSGSKYLVVGVDGNQPEDENMVRVFRNVGHMKSCFESILTGSTMKVFSHHGDTIVLRLESCIGWSIARDASDPSTLESRETLESSAFAKLYAITRHQLEKSIFSRGISRNETPLFVCFTQPHAGLKEIRLATLILSIVLADLYDTEYIWSSDSDTLVCDETLPSIARILSAEAKAAGASALVRLNNAHQSSVSSMASAGFMCDAFLNRAALSALGRSECLNGPGSMFKKSALRKVVVPWYQYSYPGSASCMVCN